MLGAGALAIDNPHCRNTWRCVLREVGERTNTGKLTRALFVVGAIRICVLSVCSFFLFGAEVVVLQVYSPFLC
jgi:hypothetical protein